MGTGSKAVLCVMAARSFLFEKWENRSSNSFEKVRACVVPERADPGRLAAVDILRRGGKEGSSSCDMPKT